MGANLLQSLLNWRVVALLLEAMVTGTIMSLQPGYPAAKCSAYLSPTGVVLKFSEMQDLEADLLRKARSGGFQMMGPYRTKKEKAEAEARQAAEDQRVKDAKAAAYKELGEYECVSTPR